MPATWTCNHGALGLADGTALVQGAGGNTAAPDYWPTVTRAGGGTANANASGGVDLTATAAAQAAQLRAGAIFAAAGIAVETEVEWNPWPETGEVRLAEVRNAADTGYAARLNLTSAGKLKLLDAAGAQRWISTASMPTSGTGRVYLGAAKGTTTTDGTLELYAYFTDAKGTTPDETPYTPGATVNAGTTDITGFRIGYDSAPSAVTVTPLVVQANPAIGAIGAYADPPTVTAAPALAAYSLTMSGGTAPYVVTSATQTAGTSLGTITKVDSLPGFMCAIPTVDQATVRVVITDDGGTAAAPYDVNIPVGGTGATVSSGGISALSSGGVWV